MSHSTPARSWHWTGAATLESVREASVGTRRFLAESGLAENDLAAWELVVAEAGNNCVFHAPTSEEAVVLDLLITITPSKVIARLIDTTTGFDWPEDTELPPEDAESGRGLFLIDALTDLRTYARGSHRNILELEKSCSVIPPNTEDMEATLMAMTEELSSCYESLSSIFHFISQARSTIPLRDFASSVLSHLIQSTSSRMGILRVVEDGQLVTLARQEFPDCAPLPIESEALSDCLDRWIDGKIDGFSVSGHITGLVHPFSHEGIPIGTLLMVRTAGDTSFHAGEENMIRTFGEFFTQHILSRRHEEEAIRSSVARREFELAAAIQHSLLPSPHPSILGITANGHCESALSIGGDFYDLIPIKGRGWFFVIADVMGKGVASSMMAAVTRSAIRALDAHFGSPSTVLKMVAKQLFDDLERLEMFVTVVVGMADAVNGEIRIANAGHCPVLISTPEELIMVAPDNPPVGIESEPCYPEQVVSLRLGTRLLAFTDGLDDPRNKRLAFVGEEQVAEWWTKRNATPASIDDLKSDLLERLEHGKDAGLLADDQTFLMLSY